MDSRLMQMLDGMRASPPAFLPSEFWRAMNRTNLEQLECDGLDAFKRTVALNYFTWSHNFLDQLLYVARRAKLSDWPNALSAALRPNGSLTMSRREQVAVSLFTALLWLYAERRDPEGLLSRIEEPTDGSPLDIRIGDRLVSQDLANSVLEYYSVCEAFRPEADSEVCELGAGYGRTAYVFLKATAC